MTSNTSLRIIPNKNQKKMKKVFVVQKHGIKRLAS